MLALLEAPCGFILLQLPSLIGKGWSPPAGSDCPHPPHLGSIRPDDQDRVDGYTSTVRWFPASAPIGGFHPAVRVINTAAVTRYRDATAGGSIGMLSNRTPLFGPHPLACHRNIPLMAIWPRQIQSHVMDREVVVVAGKEEYRYRCIHCGVEIDDPTEPDPGLEICDRDPLLPMR